mgnify:CR=1 FL=1
MNNNNATITYQWHQVSGIAITLTNQNQPTAKLTIPNIVNNEVITIALTINDNNGNIDTKSIDLTLQYVNTPPVVTVNKELSVTAFSEVTLESDVTDQEGGVTSQWQQKSGIPVEVTPLQHTAIFFKAPSVTTDTTLTFELTAIDNDGASTTEVVTVNVLPAIVDIPPHVLLLTKERIAQVKNNIAQDDTAYNLLLSKITNYFTVVPYNAGEYAGSFALAFYLTGDNKYIQRAIELLEHAYFSEPNIGWQYYNNRNLFRVNARWAIMGYTWIKSYITEDQRIKIENILALWSDYWLEHVDFQNDFASFRVEDTDNLTSLAENITLLGYALKDSSKHANLSSQLLIAGDTLLNRFVVNYYMNDIMAGGAWAEGSDYSPNTQRHWIRIFLINKDHRNIP